MIQARATCGSSLTRSQNPAQAITAQLLFYKPDDPKAFICKYLEDIKSTGTPTLITEQDLETMFGMFDITKRGSVTAEQANRALQVTEGG